MAAFGVVRYNGFYVAIAVFCRAGWIKTKG